MSKILGKLCPSQALSQEETKQEGTDTDQNAVEAGIKTQPSTHLGGAVVGWVLYLINTILYSSLRKLHSTKGGIFVIQYGD